MKRRALTSVSPPCLALVVAALAIASPVAAQTPQEDLARYAAEMMTGYPEGGPGGVVLVARGDTVLFRAARGEADIDNGVPLRPDSVFRIGSETKQFTAAGLLTLVEAGRVSLDDPLSKYLADYPGADGITLQQLLNHTSGVPDYTSNPAYRGDRIRLDVTTAQMIDLFDELAPEFAPGSGWAYSNSGYVLVGAVIEAVTGMPWHAYLDQALFSPLGMTHTGYGDDARFADHQARGYTYENGELRRPQPMSMSQAHAAGGLVSSVDDLLIWSRALHEGRVLNDRSYAAMTTPVGKAADPGVGYGFGLVVDTVRQEPVLVHGGRIFGFISSLNYLPDSEITVVVLENDDQDDDRRGGDSADIKARKLAAMALGEPYPELAAAVSMDAATLQAAEGVYRFDGDVTRVLRLVDGILTAQRAPGRPVALTPIGPDDFLYADGFNRLKLERNASGQINGIRFFARGEGDGVVGERTEEPLPEAPVSLRLPREVLERLTGEYEKDGLTLNVFIEGESLKAELAGQPPVDLRATSPIQFAVTEDDAMLEFSAGDAPAETVTMRQNGRELVLRRAPLATRP